MIYYCCYIFCCNSNATLIEIAAVSNYTLIQCSRHVHHDYSQHAQHLRLTEDQFYTMPPTTTHHNVYHPIYTLAAASMPLKAFKMRSRSSSACIARGIRVKSTPIPTTAVARRFGQRLATDSSNTRNLLSFGRIVYERNIYKMLNLHCWQTCFPETVNMTT